MRKVCLFQLQLECRLGHLPSFSQPLSPSDTGVPVPHLAACPQQVPPRLLSSCPHGLIARPSTAPADGVLAHPRFSPLFSVAAVTSKPVGGTFSVPETTAFVSLSDPPSLRNGY